jgi:hypothetical protein
MLLGSFIERIFQDLGLGDTIAHIVTRHRRDLDVASVGDRESLAALQASGRGIASGKGRIKFYKLQNRARKLSHSVRPPMDFGFCFFPSSRKYSGGDIVRFV